MAIGIALIYRAAGIGDHRILWRIAFDHAGAGRYGGESEAGGQKKFNGSHGNLILAA
jgi:hypothetical protein